MDLDAAREFIKTNHRAVLATYRTDGRAQLTPVTAAVDGAGYVVISTRETAVKTRNVRRDPRVTLCVLTEQFFGDWLYVDGTVEIITLPEAMEPLVDYYRSVAGEHPDWDDYRAAMTRDQRVLWRITPTHAGPDYSG
ncbi:MAG: PPOX class F420-dependent oxidoreductase [Mycobacteriales bacterium]